MLLRDKNTRRIG